jgi:hypothetical protein
MSVLGLVETLRASFNSKERTPVEAVLSEPLPPPLVIAFADLIAAEGADRAIRAAYAAGGAAKDSISASGPQGEGTVLRETLSGRKADAKDAREDMERWLAPLENKWRLAAAEQISRGAQLIIQAEYLLSALNGDKKVCSTFSYESEDGANLCGERPSPSSTALMLGHLVRTTRVGTESNSK